MSDSDFSKFMEEMRDAIREVKQDVERIRQEVQDIMNAPPERKRRWWQF